MTSAPRPSFDPDIRPAKNMQGSPTPLSVLGPQADGERQRIRQQFESGTSARETLRAQCELADRNVEQIFGEVLRVHNHEAQGLCLLALGGYGRRMLFPYSDLDILFLMGNDKAEQESRPLISEFSRTLWDIGFRVSSAGRTLEECKRIEEDNAEFHLALLDRRFLAGDAALYEKLDTKVLPASERQARPFLLAQIHRLTRERLTRYGNTIFQLEPNVKESPGGMRDYQATIWLRQIMDEKKEIRNITAAEEELSAAAVDFLSAIRCFLHYSNGRNDNTLTYELQAAAAERALGVGDGVGRTPAEWMRQYFRHARTLNRQLLRYLEQRSAVPLTLRQRLFNAARAAKIEPGDGKCFAVRDGLLEVLDQPVLSDRAITYSLFAEAARTGTPLSREAERSIGYILKHPELPPKNTEISRATLREILGSDYPGVALRSMQRLGLLTEILPEFGRIDSLVVRDFYHRYTVDEHSLRTIEHLQELAEPPDERGVHFAPLWKTAERRDLLILALLLHDVGKGMPVENHITGSLAALDSAARRLNLSPEEKEEVRFLIGHHLDMSATVQRRDIFDPATVSAFAQSVTTQERLQRLCLLTYADIHSVNPEALTPWKAEMLWQLFVATSNHFSRTVDRDRLHAPDEGSLLERVKALAGDTTLEEIEQFLEGFPRRYLAVHSAAEIAAHFVLYRKLGTDPVQTELIATRHGFSLTLLTADRPALFATISGVLAGWGMNINKADAFANAACVVLDTFHFADLHRTLELNPSETERFRKSLADVVIGTAQLKPLQKSRESASRGRVPKVTVETRINFDDASSAHSTLLEIVTQDHPGLLYEIGSALARLGCNIEVALIDTEGHKAIDVFYLTAQGKKLTTQKQELLCEVLQGTLV
ncbi:MAG TPA: [protein-PII] uridylyltransferase [Candidatus Limnocylindria bacterium]|nr:[protein-PII] uridylyltransferase [Candidatus Limnocylindria bacterium]